MIRVGFSMQVAKTPTYPVTCRFPVFPALAYRTIGLCDHNPPMLQIDGRTTDVMLLVVA